MPWPWVSVWSVLVSNYYTLIAFSNDLTIQLDTGEEKKKLVLSLGAEKWIDFKQTKDLVKDVKDATGGAGPHAAVVAAAHVSKSRLCYGECRVMLKFYSYRLLHTSRQSII